MLDPGEKIVDCPPTFSMYVFDAAVNGAGVIKGERFILQSFSSQSLDAYGLTLLCFCFHSSKEP